MAPYFNAMGRTNYARWLPIYLVDMRQLSEKHSLVLEAFMAGEHAVSRSNQPFSNIWTDMALDQSINLDYKTAGGIVGISQKPGALERWFLTVHERAAVATALRQMCGIPDSDLVAFHKDARDGRLARDEDDVQKLKAMFDGGGMTNPFHIEDGQDDIHPLMNFATGIVMPEESAVRMINVYDIGLQQCSRFVRERLDSNERGFWEPLPHLNIKPFQPLSQNRQVGTNEKVVTISADRDLFGRLVIATGSRQINLKTYELCAVPLSLSSASTAYITDGMATIQAVGTGKAAYLGDLAILHYKMLTSHLGQHCTRVDVVFDQYKKMSIKDGERQRRATPQSSLVGSAERSSLRSMEQWKKYFANPRNKANLSSCLTQRLCELGMSQLQPGQKIVIGGGYKDGERAVMVANNQLFRASTPTTRKQTQDCCFMSSMRQESADALSLPAFHAITGCDSTGTFYGIGKKKAWSVMSQDPEHQANLAIFGSEPEMGVECFWNSENFATCMKLGKLRAQQTTCDTTSSVRRNNGMKHYH
ncbi:hypothetical protein Bbelb_376770 [Branchiostoma belcheri]|nr:hypothetical protein Bbelb_376770 [Branchiostoma belcheri]